MKRRMIVTITLSVITLTTLLCSATGAGGDVPVAVSQDTLKEPAALSGASPTSPATVFTTTTPSTTSAVPEATTSATSSTTQSTTKATTPTTKAPERYYIPSLALSRDLQQHTFTLCQKYGICYELVLSVMYQESRFQPDAQRVASSGTTYNSLMQVSSNNAAWLKKKVGVTDLMDPKQNILAGVYMLSLFIEKYGEHDGLMAYQLGEGGMLAAKKDGRESTGFAKTVLARRDKYVKLTKTD